MKKLPIRFFTLSLGIFFCLSNHFAIAQFTVPKILKHPANQIQVEIINILNSPFRETNLNISPDGKYMFFMSGRGQQPWSGLGGITYKGKPEYDGDIWYAQKIGNRWAAPQVLGNTVNTGNGEDEPNISPDGQTVYYQSWDGDWDKRGGPYYKSKLNGNVWGFPNGLSGGITAFFADMYYKQKPFLYVATDGATMSADGNTFIVAAGKDYDGNMDFYISRKNAYGQWSYLKKLSISTMGNERSPFLASDGKTLYFASDGYGGWGGLEILKTTVEANDSHGEVVNLGAPFNTWLDDYGFVLTASGDDAYFVREGDIYYANTKNANPELKPASSTLMIQGIVTSTKTKKGIGADIKIINPTTKAIIAQTQSNAITGEYAIILPLTATKFVQEVSRTGFTKANKDFETKILPGFNKINADVELNAVEIAPTTSLLISGIITDSKTKKGTSAEIKIIDSKTQKVVAQGISNAQTGQYSINLPITATEIVQEVTKKGFQKQNRDFKTEIKVGVNKIDSNIALKLAQEEKECAAAMGKDEDKMQVN